MHDPQSGNPALTDSPTVFGHPAGLFTLFFAEMWERFSFYGMRALLVLYMIKGFLKYDDTNANAIYGAYTALVYMTPFFGGLLADRLLGQRRAVILGGLLMAAGHQLMAVQTSLAFFMALALLIAGNGFFKPNISTIVGSLYAHGNPKRDGGFTIFYMGVNLGAAISPLLCGYVGETYGWHYGFGLATIGMLIGLAIFVAPTILTQTLILLGATAVAFSLFILHPDNTFSFWLNIFSAVSILLSGIVAVVALSRGGVPEAAGAPPDPALLKKPVLGPITAEWMVYLGTAISIVVFGMLVSGFVFLSRNNRPMALIPEDWIAGFEKAPNPLWHVLAVVLRESSRPATLALTVAGVVAFGYVIIESIRLPRVPRQRMYVVLTLTFFSMLFWSFFEQAGSSVNNFTDRNVDRVIGYKKIVAADVGKALEIEPTQKQLGYHNGKQLFTLNELDKLREEHKQPADDAAKSAAKSADKPGQDRGEEAAKPSSDAVEEGPAFTVSWKVAEDNVGMELAHRSGEIPASTYQSVNATFILIFGLPFTALWAFLAVRGWEPSTTVKFALGLLQLGLGFIAFWYGAHVADSRGMVCMSWLILGYLLHTTGELCLSPVGLSMVTKLSPRRLVSTVMGAWFLATAFSQMLASIIAQFTGVTEEGANGVVVPIPKETLHVYGDVFLKIAVGAIISAAICLALAPILNRWMHDEVEDE